MEEKMIRVVVNGTEFTIKTELIYDDTSTVPVINRLDGNQSWCHESRLRSYQGRK